MAFTFSGASKRIILSAGTTAINLADMYSRYKEWVLADNASAPLAFTTVGGDIPAIPLYLFLENGWRVLPQSSDHILVVSGGVLEVQGGGDPFVDPAGRYRIRVMLQTPGIAIGYSSTGGTGSTGPDAATIADAVWQRGIEAGFTAEQMMRILMSFAAGNASSLNGPNPTFMSIAGDKARLVGAVTGTSRTINTRDGT